MELMDILIFVFDAVCCELVTRLSFRWMMLLLAILRRQLAAQRHQSPSRSAPDRAAAADQHEVKSHKRHQEVPSWKNVIFSTVLGA